MLNNDMKGGGNRMMRLRTNQATESMTSTRRSSGRCLSLTLLVIAAGAQLATAANTDQLDEVVVTAQKRSERLLDVPIDVTNVTGDQLNKRGIGNPADLETVVPGFTERPTGYGTQVFTIRGLGFYNESLGIAPTVSVYVDQVPLPFTTMAAGAVIDLDRVEVLKGPQGTLFGQNVTGGAINFIAGKPTKEFAAGYDATVGNFGATKIGGFLSGPLADTVQARFYVVSDRRGDWQQSQSRAATLGARDFFAMRFLLDWQASDKLDFELNVNGYSNRSDTQAPQYVGFSPLNSQPGRDQRLEPSLIAFPPAPKDNRIADWDPNRSFKTANTFLQTSLHTTYRLPWDMTLISITAYSDNRLKIPTDNDGTPYMNVYITDRGHLQSFTQELRLSGSLINESLKWMIGGNYENDDTVESQLVEFIGSNTNINYAGSGYPSFIVPGRNLYFNSLDQPEAQKARTLSAFGGLDYAVTDSIGVQGSVRATSQHRDYHACLNDTGGGDLAAAFTLLSNEITGAGIGNYQIPPHGCITLATTDYAAAHNLPVGAPITLNDPNAQVTRSASESYVAWRLATNWKPTPDTNTYISATRGFKAGNFANVVLPFEGEVIFAPQEEVLSFELGFKASLLDHRLQFSSAVFNMDYKNKQSAGYVFVAPFGDIPTLVSVPKSRVKGAEMELSWRATAGLIMTASASYVDTKVTSDFIAPNILGVAANRKGESLPGSPKWQILADAEYKFPLLAQWTGFVGASGEHIGDSHSFFGDSIYSDIPNYTLLDLRAGMEREGGKYRLQFWGKNVTDKFYIVHAEDHQDALVRLVGMPATYRVTFSERF